MSFFLAAPIGFTAPVPSSPADLAAARRRVLLRRAIRRVMAGRGMPATLLAGVREMPLDALRATARLLVAASCS